MSKPRTYLVTETVDGNKERERLVKAISQNQAERHVFKHRVQARIAKADDVERVLTNGGGVEHAEQVAGGAGD